MNLLNQLKSFIFWASLGALTWLMASSLLSISGQAKTSGKQGKELFEKRCGGCHALDRDKEGPRLGGVYGRAAASITSFEYSAGLQNSNLTWMDETLNKWLIDPQKLVPDNDMTFHVQSADERREIIAYLKQTSGKQKSPQSTAPHRTPSRCQIKAGPSTADAEAPAALPERFYSSVPVVVVAV